MKVCLGMIEKNEIMFLRRHLHLLIPHFDGVIVNDGNSTDGSLEYLNELQVGIIQQKDPTAEAQGDNRTAVVKEAERLGYDWLLMLDSDEMMFPEDIADIKKYMEAPENEFLTFPRVEFYADTQHYRPNLYPDYQGRGIRLGLGYHWRNSIHELVFKGDEASAASEMKHNTLVPTAHIYHYGWALAWDRRYLRYENRARAIRGEKLLSDVGYNMPDPLQTAGLKVYYGRQPI